MINGMLMYMEHELAFGKINTSICSATFLLVCFLLTLQCCDKSDKAEPTVIHFQDPQCENESEKS